MVCHIASKWQSHLSPGSQALVTTVPTTQGGLFAPRNEQRAEDTPGRKGIQLQFPHCAIQSHHCLSGGWGAGPESLPTHPRPTPAHSSSASSAQRTPPQRARAGSCAGKREKWPCKRCKNSFFCPSAGAVLEAGCLHLMCQVHRQVTFPDRFWSQWLLSTGQLRPLVCILGMQLAS